MATTTPRPRRTSEDWDAIARELLPELQSGRSLSDLRDRFGANTYALQVALGRLGFDSHGNPLELKPVPGKRDDVLARNLAKRRQKGEPFWMLEVASGKNYAEMKRLLVENGFPDVAAGRIPRNGNGN